VAIYGVHQLNRLHRLPCFHRKRKHSSRSDYIRRSLERALEFSEAHEVPLLEDPDLQRALAR